MTISKPTNQPASSSAQLPPHANMDLQGSLLAIRRAALRARQVAQQTGTDLIVMRSGEVVRVPPQRPPAAD